MARIPLIDPDEPGTDPQATELLSAVADAQPEIGVLNVHRALANHPKAMAQFFAFAETVYFDNSLPDARMRELPYLTSAMANHCF